MKTKRNVKAGIIRADRWAQFVDSEGCRCSVAEQTPSAATR